MNYINSVQGKIILGLFFAIITIFALDITNITTLTTWLHVLAGVLWVGLLYYFNFVQAPALASIIKDEDSPAVISKYIAPNALLWFRMAAIITWLLGLALLEMIGGGILNAFIFSQGSQIIGLGAWLGTIMAFNVWFIIWPNQKKILGIKKATANEIVVAKKNAALASSINVILSIPMLLTMLAHRF